MRKYAFLREPLPRADGGFLYKIMLFESEEGVYLFAYSSPDAVQCVSDRYYDTIEELYEDWNDRIDDSGWVEIEDPLPDCQHDAFIPLRVKGRECGKPEWGKFETLRDGKWVAYTPD